MTEETALTAIRKGLEVWTLQNLLDGAILASFLILALLTCRGYLEALRTKLTLRMAIEAWDVAGDLLVDGLMLAVVLIGLLVTNMDIMADIKIALPFVPAALLLIGVGLVLRLGHGARQVGTRGWWWVLALVGAACLLNWFGFTFVMEAAGHEYLELRPSAFWETMRSLRSNENPLLCMSTFVWAGPGFLALLAWGAASGCVGSLKLAAMGRRPGREGAANGH